MNKKTLKNMVIAFLIIIMSGVIFFYQTKKVGYHEDEGYTIASSVNPINGLMVATDENGNPIWLTNEYVKNYVTLTKSNILNLKAIYQNQAYDNHPSFFYTMVHFAFLFFGGNFTKYNVFVVNIIGFILSCIIIRKLLKLLNKDNLSIPILILYGLSMGTISMVIFQRMYMLLTMFVLAYFYLTLKIYKNNFEINKKAIINLEIITVLGFLTQYFFAIYAFFIFVLMIIQMYRRNIEKKVIKKYFVIHIYYAIIGILLFVPCIKHLLFSDRGLSNLGNSGYLVHVLEYIKHLAYAFSINSNNVIIAISFAIFVALVICWFAKTKEKFIVVLFTVPSIFYFLIAVKMTSFQELRYVMPMLPFICLTVMLSLENLISSVIEFIKSKSIKEIADKNSIENTEQNIAENNFQNFNEKNLEKNVNKNNLKDAINDNYENTNKCINKKTNICKNIIITAISTIWVTIGLINSKPLFLYTDYQKCLDIANANSDKSFVYVYDNFFNHMQSIPEMMIYKKSLIVNINNDNNELGFVLNNGELSSENSFVLSIKNYMDNDSIIEKIKSETDFKNIEKIYEGPDSKYEVGNNLYLVSK